MTMLQVSDGAPRPRSDWLGHALTIGLAAITAAASMAVGWGGLTAAQATTDRRLDKISTRVDAGAAKADDASSAAKVDKAVIEQVDARLGRIEAYILAEHRR